MAERATINQTVQIGVESTPGTPVAATKSLGSVGFDFGIKVDSNPTRPTGQKYASQQIVGKEWAEAGLNGNPSYTELQYLFASVLSTPTTTPIANSGTPAKPGTLWAFDSNSRGDDNPKTYTIEQGSSTRAHRMSNAIISELTLEWSREELSLGGTALARAIEDGIVMTPTPTGFDQIPVLPAQISVYMDNTAAALGTTKLLRTLSGEFSISDRYGPLWVVDRAQPSFANTIETEPDVSFTVKQMADAQGMQNLTAMRSGQTRFFRLEAIGPIMFGTTAYKFVWDMAGQVSDVNDFEDEDGVFAVEWTFGAVHDATWGKSMHVEVTNFATAL